MIKTILLFISIAAASGANLRTDSATELGKASVADGQECWNYCRSQNLDVSFQVRELEEPHIIQTKWRLLLKDAVGRGSRQGAEITGVIADQAPAAAADALISDILSTEANARVDNTHARLKSLRRLYYTGLAVGSGQADATLYDESMGNYRTACHVTASQFISFLGKEGTGTTDSETWNGQPIAHGPVAAAVALAALRDTTKRYIVHVMLSKNGVPGEGHSFSLVTGGKKGSGTGIETLEAWANEREANSLSKMIKPGHIQDRDQVCKILVISFPFLFFSCCHYELTFLRINLYFCTTIYIIPIFRFARKLKNFSH